jgi:hypothetical protein
MAAGSTSLSFPAPSRPEVATLPATICCISATAHRKFCNLELRACGAFFVMACSHHPQHEQQEATDDSFFHAHAPLWRIGAIGFRGIFRDLPLHPMTV